MIKRFKKLKLFLLIISICSTIFLASTTFFILYTINTVELDLNKLYRAESNYIYDINDDLMAITGVEKRNYVNLNQISKNMINAILSIEDKRFYQHHGLDYKRIFSSLITDIKAGSFKEGGSTINQQLIKNTHLSNEKKITRKIKEMYLAVKLDNNLSKDQILECYLNTVLFGKQIYGIKEASLSYFGHEPSELTISEAALLAGMVQSPNRYDPTKNYDEALKRRNLVLLQMYKNNLISNSEYQKEASKAIKLVSNHCPISYHLYSSYLDLIANELKEYNIDKNTGLHIHTSFNPTMSNKMIDIVNKHILREDICVGICLIDSNTGLIEGIYGRRDTDSFGLNYALVKHQPGSTIKPILDYAPAIEYLGYGTGTLILDEEMTYQNGTKINNWDHKFKGNITIRKALVESRNIPAVKLFNEVGHKKCFQLAQKFGIFPEEYIYEANAIGGFINGYSVLEMTNAYQALANNGKFIKSRTIRYIDGYQINNPKESVAVSYETSYMLNHMLKDVGKNNTPIYSLDICAKTGQTNFDEETLTKYHIPKGSVKDAWYIGYTPQKVIGIWTGFKKLTTTSYLDYDEKNLCKEIFKELITLYQPFNQTEFYLPNTISFIPIDISTGLAPTEDSLFSNIKTEIFKIG